MNNILITGADGQLGRELQRLGGSLSRCCLYTDIATLDVTDPDAIERIMNDWHPAVIINCAAFTDVERAEEEREAADRLNRVAPGLLARAAKRYGSLLVHISTDYVFDGMLGRPCKESDMPSPLDVYGETKLKGEQAVVASGCRYVILRTAWLYSEWGDNFLNKILHRLVDGSEVRVVDDRFGSPTWAADLAQAIFQGVSSGAYDRNGGIYHYSGDGECSRYEFARRIAQLSGYDAEVVRSCRSDEFPTRARRPIRSTLDTDLYERTFGIRIPRWEKALERCMARMGILDKQCLETNE